MGSGDHYYEDFFREMDKDECKKRLGLSNKKKYLLFTDSNKKVRWFFLTFAQSVPEGPSVGM